MRVRIQNAVGISETGQAELFADNV
jgi:hypothetical protein